MSVRPGLSILVLFVALGDALWKETWINLLILKRRATGRFGDVYGFTGAMKAVRNGAGGET